MTRKIGLEMIVGFLLTILSVGNAYAQEIAPLEFFQACVDGYSGLVKMGLDQNTDFVNLRGSDGSTPLMLASYKGHKEIVELLLANGADVNATTKDGKNVLYFAVLSQLSMPPPSNDVIQILLLDKNLKVNEAIQKEDFTPLMIAITICSKDVVENLILRGADINAKTGDETTVLMLAVISGRKDIVELLLLKGADITRNDKDGKTALMYAEEEGYYDIANLIKQVANKNLLKQAAGAR